MQVWALVWSKSITFNKPVPWAFAGPPPLSSLRIFQWVSGDTVSRSKTDGASLQALCCFLEQLRQVDIQGDRDAEQGI